MAMHRQHAHRERRQTQGHRPKLVEEQAGIGGGVQDPLGEVKFVFERRQAAPRDGLVEDVPQVDGAAVGNDEELSVWTWSPMNKIIKDKKYVTKANFDRFISIKSKRY